MVICFLLQENVVKVIERVAQNAEKKGQYEDAVRLYDLAGVCIKKDTWWYSCHFKFLRYMVLELKYYNIVCSSIIIKTL